jgi:tetratricopeptide (TPR) repeat protein
MNRYDNDNRNPMDDMIAWRQLNEVGTITAASSKLHDESIGNEITSEGDSSSTSSISDQPSRTKVIVETEPSDAELWNRKGISFARSGQYKEAFECFEKALSINPNHQGAWINKGNILLKLEGKEQDALKCFNKSIDVDPNDAEAWYVKGVCLARLDMMEDALISYEHATELEPRHSRAWYGMGLAARYLGYKKRAEECFKKSKKIERD